MAGEKQANYCFALECLLECLDDVFEELKLDDPAVIFHDRDQAEMIASEAIFPNTPTMLCTWHIKTNMEATIGEKIG